MSQKRLDEKLARIRAGQYTPADFIIADAKDADMGFGAQAPGPDRARPDRYKSKAEYLEAMRANVKSGFVDIMLMSASSTEQLVDEGLFTDSPVTPAVRLNDTTDIWNLRGARYRERPARPHRTADLKRARALTDLGLYAVTFSNDLERDLETLRGFTAFRAEAVEQGMRYFLEVFNPANDINLDGADLGSYVNDAIVRALAGVTSAERPLFLKMQYNGPRALEELASYEPGALIVGILGGARGTTRDTFELAAQSERHGARVALFGRKINLAEAPVDLLRLIRAVVERQTEAADAVRAYHNALKAKQIAPDRPLEADLEITDPVLKG
jgi:DhnA family fructose-bisphosphate aldolase class Ia